MNIAEVRQNHKTSMGNPLSKRVQKGELKLNPSFSQVMDSLRGTQNASSVINKTKALSISDPRLPGDFISSFRTTPPTPAASHAQAQGLARSFGKSGEIVYGKKEIDKTSKLYEQALELESYFVKVMLDSMRKTLTEKTLAGDQSFAGKMYKDMMYDELGRSITKNAGLGLADQIYLELSHK